MTEKLYLLTESDLKRYNSLVSSNYAAWDNLDDDGFMESCDEMADFLESHEFHDNLRARCRHHEPHPSDSDWE